MVNYYPIENTHVHRSSIPYGRPLANQTLLILDNELTPCPDCRRTVYRRFGIISGYRKDEIKPLRLSSLTLRLENDYIKQAISDVTSLMAHQFLGRNDHQVKINGYRIELGEVEPLRHCPVSELNERLQSDCSADCHER